MNDQGHNRQQCKMVASTPLTSVIYAFPNVCVDIPV
jgi:hypothetical protein